MFLVFLARLPERDPRTHQDPREEIARFVRPRIEILGRILCRSESPTQDADEIRVNRRVFRESPLRAQTTLQGD